MRSPIAVRNTWLLPWLLAACSQGQTPEAGSSHTPRAEASPAIGTTIGDRFDPPAGYTRSAGTDGSFARYLRSLPLKPEGAQVHLYNGELKRWQGGQAAVVNISVGDKDLQQCADAVMRLRAEYLFAEGKKTSISFHFTNGFEARFAWWLKGERIRVDGNQAAWYNAHQPGASHDDLLAYLHMVFTYAGTASLSKELVPCADKDIEPGDVFIQGGHPGHAVIVVDVARNAMGDQLFLLAQSYMPAQEIHVLKNLEDTELSPWFKLNAGKELETPEWTFRWDDRKRWP